MKKKSKGEKDPKIKRDMHNLLSSNHTYIQALYNIHQKKLLQNFTNGKKKIIIIIIPLALCRNIMFDFGYTNSKSNYFTISNVKQLTIKIMIITYS